METRILDSPKFRGRSAARVDAKGRLRISTKFREVLQKHFTDALFISRLGDCLVAYPPEKWEEIEAKAMNLSEIHPDHRSFKRSFISGVEQCEFDSQGRILIPPMLRKDANIDQEVVLVGMLTCFEIWDKSAYESQSARDRENEPGIRANIAGIGI
ncbi:MAG: division/cell wall cluster transcriptional repressor MraZ [Syntrophobacteraceae bacterium]|nr:division/cell wall cluster transcriptional repressor MraZ [Syntrophobacteraceae bacterium]